MPPIDKNGTDLKVGDPIIITGHVASIVDADSITMDSTEINYPTSTTALKTLTVNSRIVVKN